MKRLLILMLVCLVLCGCAAEAPVEETTEPAQTEAVAPTEPAGYYDPDSAIEEKTDGAVRSYPLSIADCYAVVCVGPDVVVFSGKETTTLTMLSGENLFVSARIALGQYISPEQPSTQVTEKGISYFSAETGELVLLDTALKEVARIATPNGRVGEPLMSSDRKRVYYCTAESIRVLELETGISRLLMEISYPGQTLEGLLLQDTVLRCRLTEESGEERTLFLSTEDGTSLYETRETIRLVTCEDRYYATVPEGAMNALVFGGEKLEGLNLLLPRDVTADAWFLETLDAAVTASMAGDNTAVLEYYSLADGLRRSVLELENSSLPCGLAAAPDGKHVYVLCRSEETGGSNIYRWDVDTLAINDGEVYTSPRYTLKAPDTAGLEECKTYAGELSERYGVEILLFTDATAVKPADYILETEYQVPLIRRELEKLSYLLSVYPERFLAQAAENTAGGVIRIALVRSIQGAPETGSMEYVEGVHFWVNEAPYIAFAVGQTTDKVVHHELFHAIETKVLADSQVYYEWDKLNPKGFEYDYNYTDWLSREESEYLTEEDRAFIDSYAMSFPNEDRARIMEYAMTEGNESYFQSEIMQEKLYQLCLGIRKAFGLTKSEETYPWEQYLNESLAYVPKNK